MKSFDWRNMELRDFFALVAIGILLFTVIFAFGFLGSVLEDESLLATAFSVQDRQHLLNWKAVLIAPQLSRKWRK